MDKKQKTSIIIVFSIIAIVYLVCFLVIPFEKTSTFWISFIFGLISIIIGCVIAYYGMNNEGIKSKIYGFPIFRLGYSYTAIQIFITLIICIICKFSNVPNWIPVVISLILLACTLIGVIAVDNAKAIIEKQELQDSYKTKTIESFRVNIDSLINLSSDSDINKAIEKLADEFKYSDPVSNDAVKEIESLINSKVAEMKKSVDNRDVSLPLITEISNLLRERNAICKSSK